MSSHCHPFCIWFIFDLFSKRFVRLVTWFSQYLVHFFQNDLTSQNNSSISGLNCGKVFTWMHSVTTSLTVKCHFLTQTQPPAKVSHLFWNLFNFISKSNMAQLDRTYCYICKQKGGKGGHCGCFSLNYSCLQYLKLIC